MARARGDLSVEFLVKVVLALVAVWLSLAVLESLLDLAFGVFALLRPLVVLVVVVLIALVALDRR